MMQCFFFLPHTRDDDIRHSSMYDQIQCTCASKVCLQRTLFHRVHCKICNMQCPQFALWTWITGCTPSVSLLDKMAACVCSVVQLEFNFGAAGIVLQCLCVLCVIYRVLVQCSWNNESMEIVLYEVFCLQCCCVQCCCVQCCGQCCCGQ